MKLSLGFSPCPNDTFIFDALVNGKIDREGLEFEPVLEDVQTLNEWTLQGKLDITKLSFPAFFQAKGSYVLLHAGSALGKGVGPLLISASEEEIKNVESRSIAIPGVNTTANLLLGFAFPNAKNKRPMIFSAIEDAVLNGTTDLGVIIHENRFTYQQRGLYKVLDLGEYWEQKMKVPIPLGGISMKRAIDSAVSRKVDRLIRKSIEYAFERYPLINDYVKQHSQTMSEEVMRQHIDLYVNNFSIDLGEEGQKAIIALRDCFDRVNNEQNATTFPLFL